MPDSREVGVFTDSSTSVVVQALPETAHLTLDEEVLHNLQIQWKKKEKKNQYK